MHKGLVWIAAGTLLAPFCTLSAKVASVSEVTQSVVNDNYRSRLVHPRHCSGADCEHPAPQHSLAAAPVTEGCRAAEPSKLGLLRSSVAASSKAATTCRKLRG